MREDGEEPKGIGPKDTFTGGTSVTEFLLAWKSPDPESLSRFLPAVCQELQAMARAHMAREHARNTLQPTALVNEFFLRLASRKTYSWKSRGQFFAFASSTMRRILVDHARRRNRLKHGGGQRPLSLDPEIDIPCLEDERILLVSDALLVLETFDRRKAKIVEQRFFVGLTVAETAAALEISEPTVKREWRAAKLWLRREIDAAACRNGALAGS